MRRKRKTAFSIWLDYGSAATKKLLGNISAAAMVGPYLWTASDEGRTVECLEPDGSGFRLHRQFPLDGIFSRLPGKAADEEADIEALSFSDGILWICGSHCRVRRNCNNLTNVDARFSSRESRCLLGAVALTRDGGGIDGAGFALPFRGAGSLRKRLGADPYLAPFLHLPSKENGLDIEGLCVTGTRLFLGLRGPVLESIAIAVELEASRRTVAGRAKPIIHFLDLKGLGIRDLAVDGPDILVLAGPVSAVNAPFRIYRWRPRQSAGVQHPHLLKQRTKLAGHPEGICLLRRKGKRGVLVLYDTPEKDRVEKSRYRADWIALSEFTRKR